MRTNARACVMAAGLAGLLCAAPTRMARAQDMPEGVQIERLMYRGTGCKRGTADARIVGGGTAFLLLFTDFNAQASSVVSPSENRSRCNVSIHLSYPPGWSFTASSLVYRGSAVLGQRVVAQMEARYNFPGTPSSTAEATLTGPSSQDFEIHRQFDTENWSPCARHGALPIEINARVDIDNRESPSSTGVISVDQQDGTFDFQFNLRWRRCGG